MTVQSIEVTVSAAGVVSGYRPHDGAYGPSGPLGFNGVDAELIRVFERWLAERGREWRHAELRAFGSLLHRVLFPDDLWRWVEQAFDNLGPGDRIRLQLAFPRDAYGHLAAVPWEYLYAPDRPGRQGFFLATDRRCALTRHIPLELGKRDISKDAALRVLVLVSQPEESGLAEVVAEPVLEQLTAMAGGGLPLDLTVHRRPTRDLLFDLMPKLRPDVVQFMGHGRYDEQEGQGSIALVDEAGAADWVTESALAQLLGDPGDMPRLVYLHSCAGAKADYQSTFAGLAPQLIRRGTQCVVAMQYAVTNRTAIAFSDGFYRGLTDGLPLDQAVQAGRRSLDLKYGRDPRLLGIPVVYLNSLDALLVPKRTEE